MKKTRNKASKNGNFNKSGSSRGQRRPDSYNRRREEYGAGECPDQGRSGRNDVSWYSKNPNLLVAAASFPYPNRPGMQVRLGNYTNDSGTTYNADYSVPGAMALHWIPSLGISNAATDPASVLGKEMYARVRQVYSGSLDADAPDFVMYVMAIDSIYTYIAWLKRVYRILNAWSPDNYFMPDGLLSAMNFSAADIASLRQNKTEFWQLINELVLQTRKFTVPSSMDIFNRHYWMSDNVYTDAPSINSQFYLFTLDGVYKYAALNMPTGDPAAGLAMTKLPVVGDHATITPDVLYQFGLDLINALVAWDDAYTINGYLRRAFEGDGQFLVSELASTEILTPVYEPEVLAQIENSRCAPGAYALSNYTGFNVTQNVTTNAVISNPTFTVTVAADVDAIMVHQPWRMSPWLSIRSDSPTVADSVIASRLQVACTAQKNSSAYVVSVSCGTEVPLYWTVGRGTFNGAGVFTGYAFSVYHQVGIFELFATKGQSDIDTKLSAISRQVEVSAFDWHPLGYFVTMGSTGANPTFNGDIHNMSVISTTNLQNLHKICMYSEMNSFGLI